MTGNKPHSWPQRWLTTHTDEELGSVCRLELTLTLVMMPFMGLALGITLPILVFFAQHLHTPPSLAPLVFAVLSGTSFLMAAPWGMLCDRIGPLPVMLLSLVGITLGYRWLALAQDPFDLFGSRVWHGLFAGLMPAALAMVSRVARPKLRARMFGLMGASFASGITLGPALTFLMLPNTDPLSQPLLAVYRNLLTISFAASLIMTILVALGVLILLRHGNIRPKRNNNATAPAVASSSCAESGGPIFGLRWLWGLLVLGLVALILFSALESSFALWGQRAMEATARQISLLIVISGLANIVTQGGLMNIILRWCSHQQAGIMALLMLCMGCLLTITHIWPAVYAGSVLLGMGIGLWTPLLQAMISQASPQNHVGRHMGYHQSCNHLARTLGPLWSGVVIVEWGNRSVFVVAILGFALIAISLAGLWHYGRHCSSTSTSDNTRTPS